MTEGRIQTRVREVLEAWLTGRARRFHAGSTGTQARTELELWHSALITELRRVRLTLAQASCIADVLNDPVMDVRLATGLGVVYAQCYDAFRLARGGPGGDVSSYGKRWGIDEHELLTYLATLGPVADHALCDAIARWWELGADATAEGFAKAGLTVTDDDQAAASDQES